MQEKIIELIRNVDPWLVYLLSFLIAFIENLFPPFPSDVVVVLAGTIAGTGKVNVFLIIGLSTIGSTLGFITAYFIGDKLGDKILEKGKIKFIKPELIFKVEKWFNKYGYWIIIINRFLAGTRAVVSYFAGMSELNLLKTSILSFLSALIWNSILVYAGYSVGDNYQVILDYISTYNEIFWVVFVVIIIFFFIRKIIRKNPEKFKK